MKRLIYIVLLLTLPLLSLAGKYPLAKDSLHAVLNSIDVDKNPEDYRTVLKQLMHEHGHAEIHDSILHYSHLVLHQDSLMNNLEYLVEDLLLLGEHYDDLPDIDMANECFLKCIDLYTSQEKFEEAAHLLSTVGRNQYSRGEYSSAMNFYMKAQDVYLAHGIENNRYGYLLHYIGSVFKRQDNYRKAYEYYSQELRLAQKIGSDELKAEALYLIAQCGNDIIGSDEKRLELELKSLELYERMGDEDMAAIIGANVGITLNDLGRYKESLGYLEKVLAIRMKRGDEGRIVSVLTSIANLFIDIGDAEKALQRINQAEPLLPSINHKRHIRLSEFYETSYRTHEALGNYEEALKFYKQKQEIESSIVSTESIKQVAQLEARYGSEMKEKEISELEQVNLAAAAKSETQRIIIWSVSGGLALLLAMVLLIIRSYRSNQRNNQLLMDQNLVIEEAYRHTEMLSEIGKEISSSLSVEKIIDKVYYKVNELMDASTFTIGLFVEKENAIVFPSTIEKGTKLAEASISLDDDKLAVWCYKNQQDVIVNDAQVDYKKYTAQTTAILGEMPESVLYVPITTNDKKIGVLTVQSFEKHVYTEYHLNVLQSLAVYVAVALDNANLYENMEHEVNVRTKEIKIASEATKLLSEIGQHISSTLDFEMIFDELHRNVSRLMDAEMFGIRIYHPDSNEIEYKYEIESGKRDPSEFVSMDDDDNYTVWCIKNRKEIFINDNLNEYKKYVNEIKVPSGEMPNSLMFHPLIVDDEVAGVITVQSFALNAYREYHLNILKNLASYAGSALRNAMLYESLEVKVEERTSELSVKNKSITDSINYAKRIQVAILPHVDALKEFFPESFIYFAPRDIVSGDFYWLRQMDRKLLVLCGDCTGHGVPGGFMSMIINTLLNDYVNEYESPGKLLADMDAAVIKQLGQGDSSTYDGMDAAICEIDLDTNNIIFSGSHRPLLVDRGGELEIIRGNNNSVGGINIFEIEKEFTNQEVSVKSGETIYMFSDGYPDQFGGVSGQPEKIKLSGVKKLIEDNRSKPMAVQGEVFEKYFQEWKGDYGQLDDVCLMGIRL